MPESVTSLTNNNRYWRQKDVQSSLGDTPDRKKYYYIVKNQEGEIVYEGRVEGVCHRYNISTEEFRDLELLREPLPGGHTFIRQHKDERHMKKKTMIYTVMNKGDHFFEGTLSETSSELGMAQSMICDLVRSQKAYLGQYTFSKHEEWR